MSDEVQYVEEAPESGKPYARKFQLWVETYDRATLEQFITAVRGLAEGAALEADRSFTEAERAKREADRAKTMADSTATHNQNCQTAVTTCTQLVQQAKTAEVGANQAAGTAGGHSQTATQAAQAAQADAGRAQADAKRAKDEADRAQRIVDGFNPGTGGGGGGGYGHSEILDLELGNHVEPHYITKDDLGKTILVDWEDRTVWLGVDTGADTDMVPGDFCEIVVQERPQPFVVRARHGVSVTVAGGNSLAFSGPTTIRIQKLAANSWSVSSTAFDNAAGNRTAILGNHIYGMFAVEDFPELTRLDGVWDRINWKLRGAYLDADQNVVITQSQPLADGNYSEWKRTMASGALPDQPESSGYADLVGEYPVFVGEWVRNAYNVRYIYGAVNYEDDADEHKLYIGGPGRAPKRLEFVEYPADRYSLMRVLAREDAGMSRFVLQVWFYDKLGDEEIFRLFMAENTENDHVFQPSTLGAPNLDDYEIYAQWSGTEAYLRYDTLWGRSRDNGKYFLLEEGPDGWTPDQPWVERAFSPAPMTEPRFHTDLDNKAAIGWMDTDGNLWLRLICAATVDYNDTRTIQDVQVPDLVVLDYWFGKAHEGFLDVYILTDENSLVHIQIDWDIDQQVVNFIHAGVVEGPWLEVVGQCRVWLPRTSTPGYLLIVKRDHPVTTEREYAVIYSGYDEYNGESIITRPMHLDDATIRWDPENLINYDLTVWGCWLEYSFHENRWGWWWGIQTSDGVWFFDRDRCSIPFDITTGDPQ